MSRIFGASSEGTLKARFQVGKRGPLLVNAGASRLSVTDKGGVTLANLGGADPVQQQDFATKASSERAVKYEFSISIGDDKHSYFKTDEDSYEVARSFIFKGTAALSQSPDTAKVIGSSDEDGMTASFRIYDATNGTVVAQVSGAPVGEVPAIINLGAVSNLPSAEAIFEVQLKRDSGSGDDVRISYLELRKS